MYKHFLLKTQVAIMKEDC